MQTHFSLARLADPRNRASEAILRACVHCGFCTATCPTFVLTGDELDSPRGRIYLIKEMLEKDGPVDAETVLHVDRCLSCLSCMTTCPSGVNYMHLVDHARQHVEEHVRRPLSDRLIRVMLAAILPYPRRMRAALRLGALARPLAPWLARAGETGKRLAALLALVPRSRPAAPAHDDIRPPAAPRARVALLEGCAQSVVRPSINEAARRILSRLNIEVATDVGEGCCGAIVHHMGREEDGRAHARRAIDAWTHEIDSRGLDAILITTSGCGTAIKDYGFLFRDDPVYAERAARVSALARDISEYLAGLDLPQAALAGRSVAYHAACSLQHGQRVTAAPRRLLETAGFALRDIAEGHLCCGSAGTYNILQPDFSSALRERKIANILAADAEVIATGNIGCILQLDDPRLPPILHTIELLDQALGGTHPEGAAAGNEGLEGQGVPRLQSGQ